MESALLHHPTVPVTNIATRHGRGEKNRYFFIRPLVGGSFRALRIHMCRMEWRKKGRENRTTAHIEIKQENGEKLCH